MHSSLTIILLPACKLKLGISRPTGSAHSYRKFREIDTLQFSADIAGHLANVEQTTEDPLEVSNRVVGELVAQYAPMVRARPGHIQINPGIARSYTLSDCCGRGWRGAD